MADLIRAVVFGGDTPWLLLAAPVALVGAGIAWFLTPRDRR